MDKWHQSQRGYFAGALYEIMKRNKKIYLLVGDLGYKFFDKIFEKFPDRCINCGASEQAMVGIAVGLAQEGKIPFVYTITSFFLRAAETISLYLSAEQATVKLVGSGRDCEYKVDGRSHYAYRIESFIGLLDIKGYWPHTKEDVPIAIGKMLESNCPNFLSLSRLT